MIIGEEDKLLFVQRALNDSHRPGLWEFPGGKVDHGEALEAARYRETLEETGLQTEMIGNGLAHTQDNTVVSRSGLEKHYILRTSLCRSIGGALRLSHEHENAVWLDAVNAPQELHLTSFCNIALNSLGQLLKIAEESKLR